MNERLVEKMRSLTPIKSEKKKDSDGRNESPNRGKLIIEATCVPADISYPTDLGLLNGARVHTEKIIDILYKQLKGKTNKKPRTYRNLARKDYLAVAKRVHLSFANTSSGKLTIEISTAQRKDRGNTLDIPLRSR